MAMYRESRAIEASVLEWLQEQLVVDCWQGVRIEKVFAQVYKQDLPAILVNVNTYETTRLEVGSTTFLNYYTINFRIFGNSDGQRLDLTDWLLEKLQYDMDYYKYTIEDGKVISKELAGKITLLAITRNEREFLNTEILDKEDRYRQLLSVRVYLARL